jgi:uncharacterized protein YdhG (YjbR/CyaY superfamily)
MATDATTATEYIDALDPDRKAAIEAVRKTILANLPQGYDEVIRWGMITYEVPLETCPDTYNGQPLMLAALASQKRHMAVYLTGLYTVEALKDRIVTKWKARGTKLDMGKSCIRFKRLDQLEIELVGEVIGSFEVSEFVDIMQAARSKK